MIVFCDLCERRFSISDYYEGLIFCPYCHYDNTYQLEDSSLIDEVLITIDCYSSMDEDSVIRIASEQFGLPEDEIINIINDKEQIGNLSVKKRKINELPTID